MPMLPNPPPVKLLAPADTPWLLALELDEYDNVIGTPPNPGMWDGGGMLPCCAPPPLPLPGWLLLACE